MQKLRLGFHTFREKPIKDELQVEQACIVIAKNDDGTARLAVFEPNGRQFILDRAELIQDCEDVACHFEECIKPDPGKPAAVKPGIHVPPGPKAPTWPLTTKNQVETFDDGEPIES